MISIILCVALLLEANKKNINHKNKNKNNINNLKNGSTVLLVVRRALSRGFYSSKMSRQGIYKQTIVLQTPFNLKLKQKAMTLHTLRFKMACSPVKERKEKKEESVNSRDRNDLKHH